ncbi:hypothetical protein [Pseudolactococcus insecticola]|uniref:Dithiol-disulfide isomerase n=1 Tax=Pseudolactococcus insecticola TaxID=2709158 RepID=A0A6A0B9Z6_9LACT|nr:hypothetical protein [Lactococcus insecticola]GFH41184.1 hypothetical protein Hs20B_15820 [Lactococcus insecticola]
MTYEIQHYFTLFNDDFDFNQLETATYDWFLNPLITPTAVRNTRDAYHLTKDVTTYNAVFDRLERVTLDFLTVNFAGRKAGRAFLSALQTLMTGKTPLDYNNQVLRQILHQIDFDVADLIRNHQFARASLIRSQHNFHADKLTILPSSLIYDITRNDAVLINYLTQNQVTDYLHHQTAQEQLQVITQH